MNDLQSPLLFSALFALVGITLGIFFFLTQYRTLHYIRPQNRKIQPVLVWLQFIPFFGLLWQFLIVARIAESIRTELNTPIDDSIFADITVPTHEKPTFAVGIAYSVAFCLATVPLGLLSSLAALAGLVLWITYWIQLNSFKQQLKERAILTKS